MSKGALARAVDFYRKCFSVALAPAWSLQGLFAAVLSLLMPLGGVLWPSYEKVFNGLVWQVPLALLVGVFVPRLLWAPFRLYDEADKSREVSAASSTPAAKWEVLIEVQKVKEPNSIILYILNRSTHDSVVLAFSATIEGADGRKEEWPTVLTERPVKGSRLTSFSGKSEWILLPKHQALAPGEHVVGELIFQSPWAELWPLGIRAAMTSKPRSPEASEKRPKGVLRIKDDLSRQVLRVPISGEQEGERIIWTPKLQSPEATEEE